MKKLFAVLLAAVMLLTMASVVSAKDGMDDGVAQHHMGDDGWDDGGSHHDGMDD